jgi:ABC-type polysaccharide/polyol phosphate transport system ATPase subunit
MMQTGDIEVEAVWKTFRIFQNRNTTLKQALIRRKREQFDEFWALRDVSFSVPSGTTFGLIGANGAGKSTMLKVLARILVPDKGAVKVNGRVSALLELGAGFHPELTGRENVFLNGSILGMSAASLRIKFDEIVQFAGLESFIDQPVKTYSSGMYARLGFSVAVAVEPDILLVDEVLAVGDEQFQRRCAEKMDELRSGGRTVVLVSHGLSQIQQMCDQAVWLDHGLVLKVGATEDVVAAYLASVTTAYRLDDRGRQRTGTGEIQLEVDVLSSGDEPTATGCPLTMRFHWQTAQPMRNVGFGFTLRAADGHEVAGSANIFDRAFTDLGPGSGSVDYEISRLHLLPGSYHLAAAIMDRSTGHIYDHSPNIAQFDVASSPGYEASTGPVDLGGRWIDSGSNR